MKTPEPSVGLAEKNAKKRAVFHANNGQDSLEKPKGHGEDSLFQYTPSNYYDASGGGGTGATTRFYRDLYLKQLNQRADSSHEMFDCEMPAIQEKDGAGYYDDQSIDEEEESSEIIDEDRVMRMSKPVEEDYNFLAHLKDFSQVTQVFESQLNRQRDLIGDNNIEEGMVLLQTTQ